MMVGRSREASGILQALGFPKAQCNERSSLCLLALLDLRRDCQWSDARDPLIGITPIMEWVQSHYGKVYAPNTRETVRRQTIHQFVAAGLARRNPDDPTRAVNSGDTVYQIAPAALELMRSYGSHAWAANLDGYRAVAPSLAAQYAGQRRLHQIGVHVADGKTLTLTPGEHSELIKAIIEQFAPRFAPGATLVYVGDTGRKFAYHDEAVFAGLGVVLDPHGKMPDVVLHDTQRDWLLLVESVTSHGPVDGKRHAELAALFSASSAPLVYVTAFPSRQLLARYVQDIAWETEVWVASDPDHLIHFNGERYLGPHP